LIVNLYLPPTISTLILGFVKIDIPIAICFIAAEGINIGNLRRHGAINISKIQGAIS
jgi:hypothetical protein